MINFYFGVGSLKIGFSLKIMQNESLYRPFCTELSMNSKNHHVAVFGLVKRKKRITRP